MFLGVAIKTLTPAMVLSSMVTSALLASARIFSSLPLFASFSTLVYSSRDMGFTSQSAG